MENLQDVNPRTRNVPREVAVQTVRSMRKPQNRTLDWEIVADLKNRVEKATFWQRLYAFFVDMFVLGLVVQLMGAAGNQVRPKLDPWRFPGAGEYLDTALAILSLALPLLYFAWAYSTGGQTLGKKLLGIKVVSIDGSPLSWPKGLWRAFGYIPSHLLFNLGFLWSIRDKEKQAWHDILAGTCVVRDAVTVEQLKEGALVQKNRRNQTAWRLGLSALTMLSLAAAAAVVLSFMYRNLTEVWAMNPWPEAQASTKDIAAVDLSRLGLELVSVRDARSQETWSGGSYVEGTLATYRSGGSTSAAVWVLKYADLGDSAGDYQTVLEAAKLHCGVSKYAYLREFGVIHCGLSNGYNKIYRSGLWIIDIWVGSSPFSTAVVTVDDVRDALASHWKVQDANWP